MGCTEVAVAFFLEVVRQLPRLGEPGGSVAKMQIRLATVEDAQFICDFVTQIAQQQISPTLSEAGLKHLIAGMSTAKGKKRG